MSHVHEWYTKNLKTKMKLKCQHDKIFHKETFKQGTVNVNLNINRLLEKIFSCLSFKQVK